MLIYHPSNTKFDVVKVKYFGEHTYTRGDVQASSLPRTFWYTTVPIPEQILSHTKYIYVANIRSLDIYNLTEDAFNFKKKFNNIHQILTLLKEKYWGVKYNLRTYDMIAIFRDISPIARLTNED